MIDQHTCAICHGPEHQIIGAGIMALTECRDRLAARVAELEGAMAADDRRLREAGLRVGIVEGCDTAGAMADEIQAVRERVAELERQLATAWDRAGELERDHDSAVSDWCSAVKARDTMGRENERLAAIIHAMGG